MPIIQSAKKALRQNVKRRERNLDKKESYKKTVKEYRKFLAAKKQEGANEQLKKVYKSLDKAAKSGVIKKNKASRLKSRLAALLILKK